MQIIPLKQYPELNIRGNRFGFDLSEIDLPFKPKHTYIINLPPGYAGGNHKHTNTEAFLAFSKDLIMHWIDKSGKRHHKCMIGDNTLLLFIPGKDDAHAIRNEGDADAVLIEYSDDDFKNKVSVKVI